MKHLSNFCAFMMFPVALISVMAVWLVIEDPVHIISYTLIVMGLAGFNLYSTLKRTV